MTDRPSDTVQVPFEAPVVHDLPPDLLAGIGAVIVAFARLENNTANLIALILQLNKPEARVALRSLRPADAFDVALDLFALKDIIPKANIELLRPRLEKAKADRDALGHGIWMRHPENGHLYLRLVRGHWPKSMTRGEKVSRSIFPQSIAYGPAECRAALENIEQALSGIDAFGAALDTALIEHPDRFRPTAPVLNPLGLRKKRPG